MVIGTAYKKDQHSKNDQRQPEETLKILEMLEAAVPVKKENSKMFLHHQFSRSHSERSNDAKNSPSNQ